MNRNDKRPKAEKVLGFIVEGQTDADFIQFLVRDYFNNKFRAEIVCTLGKASMASSAKIIISSFIQSGVEHVFMLFDTENMDTAQQLRLLSEPIEKAGFIDNVTIIPAQPCIEMWMLSAFITNPEELKTMNLETIKAKLLAYNLGNQSQLFFENNIGKMIEHSKEFKTFLEKVAEKVAA